MITAQLRNVLPSRESSADVRGPGAPAAIRGSRQPTGVNGARLTLAGLSGVGARVGMGVGGGVGVGDGSAVGVGKGVGEGRGDGVGAGVSVGAAPDPGQPATSMATVAMTINRNRVVFTEKV